MQITLQCLQHATYYGLTHGNIYADIFGIHSNTLISFTVKYIYSIQRIVMSRIQYSAVKVQCPETLTVTQVIIQGFTMTGTDVAYNIWHWKYKFLSLVIMYLSMYIHVNKYLGVCEYQGNVKRRVSLHLMIVCWEEGLWMVNSKDRTSEPKTSWHW